MVKFRMFLLLSWFVVSVYGLDSRTSISIPSRPYPRPTKSCPNGTVFTYFSQRKSCESISPSIKFLQCNFCNCPGGLVFLNDSSNECVPITSCPKPPSCPTFEQYESFSKERYCPGNSRSPSRDCHCKPNYARGYDATCIPYDTCPVCGENASFKKNTRYPVKTCRNRYLDILAWNVTGCVCNSKFLYDEDAGKCVLPKDCSSEPICPPHSTYSPNGGSTSSCNWISNSTGPGCFCDIDYVKEEALGSSTLRCIPQTKCICGPNQSYHLQTCVETCANRSMKCYGSFEYECGCDNGYVYESDTNLVCIPEENCTITPTCPPNSTYTLSGYQNNCPSAEFGGTGSGEFTKGCVCNPGYVYNSSDDCISSNDCPVIDCKGNETFTSKQTDVYCDGRPTNTNNVSHVNCFCNPGYVRKKGNFECILESDCPVCSANSSYTYNHPCPTTCENFTSVCPNYDYGYRCQCNAGYVLESGNSSRCILIEECQTTPTCGLNQVYKLSGYDRDCTNLHENCLEPNDGPACFCREGFVLSRPNSQDCIPISECTCGQNQTSSIYYPYEETCESNVTQVKYKYNTTPFCVCSPGYVFENISSTRCILSTDCNLCPENENFTLATRDKTCSNWALTETSFVDPASLGVVEPTAGCFCKDGFARDLNGVCVEITTCGAPSCGENQTFAQSGYDRSCSNLANGFAQNKPLCYCSPGYVRNFTQDCILESDCPVCLDPNSYPTCLHKKDFCNGTSTTSWSCLSYCDCKPGFVFNTADMCVPSSKCITQPKSIL